MPDEKPFPPQPPNPEPEPVERFVTDKEPLPDGSIRVTYSDGSVEVVGVPEPDEPDEPPTPPEK